ncbi:MAG: SOS response-associated peptidase [Nitrospinae bacterium]|nr:SOS response-associated peptidase [Nitrospinota bacterium]
MCGRFTLTKPLKSIVSHFNPITVKTDHRERYNIAPSQEVPVVIMANNTRELRSMRWGLILSWMKDKKPGSGLINARAETVHQKPSFRSSFKARRCLVPADGYIEWVKTEAGKTPYYLYLPSKRIFSFAGLWADSQDDTKQLSTFSIITTEAHPSIQSLHPRMPVILLPDQYGFWLDPGSTPEDLKKILSPFAAMPVESRKISRAINSPKNDRPECLHPDESFA